MKKKKIILIVLISLVVICVLASAIFLLFQLRPQNQARPMVLIHAPKDQEMVSVGKGLIVHATANDPAGLRRIELWADNLLIASKEVNKDDSLHILVLSAGWVPFDEGEHLLIVRADSHSGTMGQASILVDAVEEPSDGWFAHEVNVGETLESVADIYNVTPQEIIDLNTGVDQADLLPGDEIYLPETLVTGEGDPSVSEGPAELGEDSDLPSAGMSEDRPGYLRRADEMALFASPQGEAPAATERINPMWRQLFDLLPLDSLEQLEIEVRSLETQNPYEMLHCYANLADTTPRWTPDTDFNQSTDESFSMLGDGGLLWDVAQHLADRNATRIFWRADQPIPFNIRCIGILAGGTEAVNLGYIHDQIEPRRWGILQYAMSTGGEGRFSISYKISRPAKGPDPSIPPPRNVRLTEDDHKLLWDYSTEESNAITGFAILLNDTLQWTEYRSAREARLPEQWFSVPCGDEYRFQVIAFRDSYPDGDYSLPSNTAAIQGGEVGGPGCGRSLVVTFESLNVGDLGGNQRPVYGSFYVNEHRLSFDGRPTGGNFGSPTFGLNQNNQYDIMELMYFGSYVNQLVVELPPGQANIPEVLWIGFEIFRDGRLICSGITTPQEYELAGPLRSEIPTTSPMGSLPEKCVVNYVVQPVAESPVVDPGAPPPLPDLAIQSLSVDSRGQLQIHIRNIGQASWVRKPVVAQVTSPNGELYGVFEWPNMTLVPGDTRTLIHAAMTPQPALGVCVLLDPDNLVEEAYDRLVEIGYTPKQPYCRPLPDLVIPDVSFNESTRNLQIVLQNQGQAPLLPTDSGGSLIHADVLFWMEFTDGRPLTMSFADINLGYQDRITLSWLISDVERERMRAGYTLVVNPDNAIFESDFTNNAYQVEATSRLRIVWRCGYATQCVTNWFDAASATIGKNKWTMYLDAYVGGRRVINWTSPELEVPFTGDEWCRTDYVSDWIEVPGDQVLFVDPSASLKIVGHAQVRSFWGVGENYTAADNFGGTNLVGADADPACFTTGMRYACLDGTCTCGSSVCGFDFMSPGARDIGRSWAISDAIDNDCFWTTGYMIFQAED